MPESNTPSDDAVAENRPAISSVLSRRKVLSGVAASGVLIGGLGSASADGQGGQAIVHHRDYKPNKEFIIKPVDDCVKSAHPDGSCWVPTLYYQCNGEGGPAPEPGKGGTIPFPYWHFNYVDDDESRRPRKLYTRDNKVKTGVVYRWPGNEKRCSYEPPAGEECPWEEEYGGCSELVQTGFTTSNK